MHPTGKAVLSLSEASQGKEAELARAAAEELGIPPEDIKVVHEDTDRFGAGNSFNSSPSDAVAENIAVTARKLRDKAQLIAAWMLETSPDALRWDNGHWSAAGGGRGASRSRPSPRGRSAPIRFQRVSRGRSTRRRPTGSRLHNPLRSARRKEPGD